MLKILRKQLLEFVRRLLGTEGLFQQLQQQQKTLLALGNGMTYSFSNHERMKSSAQYKRCAELIALLSPMDIKGAKYVRVGQDCDGGYVMLDDFQRKVDAAYSFGISHNVSWDEAMAGREIDVFMYDHTIKRLAKQHPRFHYAKKGITGFDKLVNCKTLGELIAENAHVASKNLILKMDIEGCEWDVFKQAAPGILSQFSQIVVELHGLTVFDGVKHKMIVEVLGKIHETHQSVHVHANSGITPFWIGDLVLPEVLEVTYVRRDDFRDRFIKNTRQFPTELDQPSFKTWPEIYLGSFSV